MSKPVVEDADKAGMKKALQLIVRQRSSRIRQFQKLEEKRKAMLLQQEQQLREQQAEREKQAAQEKLAQQRKKPSIKEKIGSVLPRKSSSRKTKGKPR
ncbi:hypothetical protein ANCCAN_11839 [Ancylostoma caninum]|uniref:Uncharacterized protein n=1 Tax=Ancylostoma caninum TaxID=29170 RepID=A0A368GCW0_ANCCA|nr:hypothetical protein ANCCAN_11839 [Ancylostoma caninum]